MYRDLRNEAAYTKVVYTHVLECGEWVEKPGHDNLDSEHIIVTQIADGVFAVHHTAMTSDIRHYLYKGEIK